MRVGVSGSSGLIGSALSSALVADDHEVVRLVRREPRGAGERRLTPGVPDPASVAGLDAVVHLAGAPLGPRRWTAGYRAEITDSRVGGTATVARAVAAADPPPAVLLTGSAIGYYGDTGERAVDESAPVGTGFLAEVVERWERAAEPASAAGCRVVHLRTGVVLAGSGGALGTVLPVFRLGLGGRLGSGRQYVSWISLADEVAAIRHLLADQDVRGPVNLTGPDPVTNADYTAVVGRAVRRPARLPVPPAALRLALDGFADEALLVSQRVLPRRLLDSGFRFRHPNVVEAVTAALG